MGGESSFTRRLMGASCAKCGAAGSIVEMGRCCSVKQREAADREADQTRLDEREAVRQARYRAI